MGNSRKDWSPTADNPRVIKNTLKRIAPSLAFGVRWIPDNDFMWDGDGPDPEDEGYIAYDVDVTVMTVTKGDRLWGVDSMGGVYDKPDTQDPDIGGYLVQMLGEALDELLGENMPAALRAEGLAAKKFLDAESKRQYEVSMRRHGHEPPTE